MTFSALSNRGARIAAAVVSTIALGVAGAPGADAHGAHHNHGSQHEHGGPKGHHHGATSQRVLAEGLLSPLRAAVAGDGTVYVSQNFAGQLMKVRPGRQPTVAYADPDGFEVGGVSVRGRVVTFTVTQSGEDGFPVDSWLKKLYPDGSVRTIAHVRGFENRTNPDAGTTYGFREADPACDAQWPAELGPTTYTGLPDSHPYSTYALPGGWTYIADAGSNAVFLVSPRGRMRTVATFPAIPYVITAEGAGALELPSCFVGRTYWFEPVPTDIDVGRDGTLYVTSLPGGPEGPELGARGSVFTVNPWTGRVRQVAKGLLGPTGIAIDGRGSLYVAQLFGNEISKVALTRRGAKVTDFLSTPLPAEVEWTPRGLYFTDNALPGEGEPPAGRLVLQRTR
jgi:hypothetical protein